jgi:hypothetical protein
MSSVLGLVDSARTAIGRYFSLVSILPSAFLVSFGYVLWASQAWHGPPDPRRVYDALSSLDLSHVAALLAATLAVGVLTHPLQFAIVQLYEGYWGRSVIARHIWQLRSSRHQACADSSRALLPVIRSWMHDPETTAAGRLWLAGLRAEAQRTDGAYPKKTLHRDPTPLFMPTRLGNVLRRYESLAGAPFGVDAVQVVPYLALIADKEHVSYLDDQRANLDLAVRISAVAILATALSVLFLWDDGLWLVLALAPYLVGYISYRGAIVAAHGYGTALATLVALNLTTLYDRLRVARPADTATERTANQAALQDLLDLDEHTELTYAAGTENTVAEPVSAPAPDTVTPDQLTEQPTPTSP